MKSFRETHPDFGVAREPVEVHLYVDGRSHVCAIAPPATVSRRRVVDSMLVDRSPVA